MSSTHLSIDDQPALDALDRIWEESVALGVDGGVATPLALYRSAGFAEIDRLDLWETASGEQTIVTAAGSDRQSAVA